MSSTQQHNGGLSHAPNHSEVTGHTMNLNNTSSSSLSFPIPNNQLKPLSSTKESSTCGGRTDAETELLSNPSQECADARGSRDGRSLSHLPETGACKGCIFSLVQSGEVRHHNDCFVVIDCSSSLMVPDYNVSFPDATKRDAPSVKADLLPITNLTVPQLTTSRLTPRTVFSKEAMESKYEATMASTSNTLHRRSDISHMGLFTAQTLDAIYSCPSEVIEEEAGTPLDRDSQRDDNIGTATKGVRPKYHTPVHRERIDSDSFRRTMEVVTCEKRSDISGDSDVSSIALDAFFSPTLEDADGEENILVENTPPPMHLPTSNSRKRLVFDSGSVKQYNGTPSLLSPKCTAPSEETPAVDGRNLFQLSSPMAISKQRTSPLSALGISVMSSFQCVIKLLQSIARGSRRCRPTCRRCRRKHRSSRHSSNPSSLIIDSSRTTRGGCCWMTSDNGRKNISSGIPIMSLLPPPKSIMKRRRHPILPPPQPSSSPSRRAGGQWEETYYLPKSSTFLKELRRSGQTTGKVIIQGWVAFRAGNVASWESIIDNPKRSDFRYIILLEDRLYLFKSRNNKKKRKERMISSSPPFLLILPPTPKGNAHLQDCMSMNLTKGDVMIAVRIHLVSKEYGNEVCILHTETDEVQCSLLPIPMPPDIFVDRHKSRLRKGDVLKRVFLDPFKKEETTTNSSSGKSSAPPSSIASASTSIDENNIIRTPVARTGTTPASAATTHEDTDTDDDDTDDTNDASLAPTEQYDVSRHVLFAIDAAIRIPLLPASITTTTTSPAPPIPVHHLEPKAKN